MPATTRKNTPRLRDGAMKRGTTWSYVIRVKDPYTGARRGELLNLRWQDIDLDLAEVRITGSAAVIGGQRIEGTTKSGRSRTVSIDPGTVQVLRDHRKRQAGERLRVGSEWRGADDYVFSTSWGEPIHPDTVSSLMTTLINTQNDQQGEPLPHARLHDLWGSSAQSSRPECPTPAASTRCGSSSAPLLLTSLAGEEDGRRLAEAGRGEAERW